MNPSLGWFVSTVQRVGPVVDAASSAFQQQLLGSSRCWFWRSHMFPVGQRSRGQRPLQATSITSSVCRLQLIVVVTQAAHILLIPSLRSLFPSVETTLGSMKQLWKHEDPLASKSRNMNDVGSVLLGGRTRTCLEEQSEWERVGSKLRRI